MINTINQFVDEHLYTHIVLIAITVTAILCAMIVDFFSGLRKARQRGEATTSRGLKRTASKASKYFTPYMVLMGIDMICCALIPWPVFSMLWGAYCVFCEFCSVREKAWQKAEMDRAAKTMKVVIENKDDIAKLAAEILFKQQQKEDDESDR